MTAPCGSSTVPMRVYCVSNSGVTTVAPSFVDRSKTASASSTANITPQSEEPAGAPPSAPRRATASAKPPGAWSAAYALPDLGIALGEEVAVPLDPPHARRLVGRHVEPFGHPAEHGAVEPLGTVGVGGVELAEVPGARRVDELRPSVLGRLPDAEPGAPRIGAHGAPTSTGDVDRRGQHAATMRLDRPTVSSADVTHTYVVQPGPSPGPPAGRRRRRR